MNTVAPSKSIVMEQNREELFGRPQRISISTNEDVHLMDFLSRIETPNINVNDITKIEPTVKTSPIIDKSVNPAVTSNNQLLSIIKPAIKDNNIQNPPVIPQENSHINQPEERNTIPSKFQIGKNKIQKTVKNEQSLQSIENGIAPKGKKVFQKDGKMYIIDPLQMKLKQQFMKKPQVSLLRPQSIAPISLLKRKVNGNNKVSVPGDHDYTKLKVSTEIFVKKTPIISYSTELETKFKSIPFTEIRHAIEFILRKLPLVSPMAKDINFRNCYPFIVGNIDEYRKLGPIKQFTFEWLRAKYIRNCLFKHNVFKVKGVWSTKEIVIYAQKHAFTPVIQTGLSLNSSLIQSDSKQSRYNLSNYINSEIQKEETSIETLSLCHQVYDWIYSVDLKIQNKFKNEESHIIDIDRVGKLKSEHCIKTEKNEPIEGKLYMTIHDNLETESILVSNFTKDIGIRLQAEDIGNGE